MRLKVNDVIEIAKKFLREQAEHTTVKIESVDTDKDKKEWIVKADVGFLSYDLKEVVIDDNDGNVISYQDVEDEEDDDDEDNNDDEE
jgi:hypothetical protein